MSKQYSGKNQNFRIENVGLLRELLTKNTKVHLQELLLMTTSRTRLPQTLFVGSCMKPDFTGVMPSENHCFQKQTLQNISNGVKSFRIAPWSCRRMIFSWTSHFLPYFRPSAAYKGRVWNSKNNTNELRSTTTVSYTFSSDEQINYTI